MLDFNASKGFLMQTATALLTTDSPSGFTAHAAAVAVQIAENLGYRTRRSRKGSVIIEVPGRESGKKIGLCAHIDTLGLMVRSITADGQLCITKIGGPILPTLDGEYCKIYTRNGKVNYVTVCMGKADLSAASLPTTLPGETLIDTPVTVGGKEYRITCVSVGNPHCVIFCDNVDRADVAGVGPLFESAPFFPERINTEFIRVVNPHTIKMRVYERGNGETFACGTGACAAVAAAVKNGFCNAGEDITVKVRGGDLTVNYTDEGITLMGDAVLIYTGQTEY